MYGDVPLLAGGVDREPALGRGIMAAIGMLHGSGDTAGALELGKCSE